MTRLPKLIAFDLDYTLWDLWIDTHVDGPLHRKGNRVNEVLDRNNQPISFYKDVPGILHKIRGYRLPGEDGGEEGKVVIAACSRTHAPEPARQCLGLLLVPPPADVDSEAVEPTRAVTFFDEMEIYPGSKLTHFKRLHKRTGIAYEDMLCFDDERRNAEVEKLDFRRWLGALEAEEGHFGVDSNAGYRALQGSRHANRPRAFGPGARYVQSHLLRICSDTRPLLHLRVRGWRLRGRAELCAPFEISAHVIRAVLVISVSPSTSLMPISSHPPQVSSPLRRGMCYHDTVAFEVEGVVHRVLRHGLEECSSVFRDMFSLPQGTSESGTLSAKEGDTDENPIRLTGCTSEEFESLIAIVYPLLQRAPELSKEKWVGVLKLARLWDMQEVAGIAIAKLSSFDLSPVEKVKLGKAHGVATWLKEGYAALLGSLSDIALPELALLGWEAACRILWVRDELARARTAVPAGASAYWIESTDLTCTYCRIQYGRDAVCAPGNATCQTCGCRFYSSNYGVQVRALESLKTTLPQAIVEANEVVVAAKISEAFKEELEDAERRNAPIAKLLANSSWSSIFNPRPTAGQSFAHSFYQLASKFLDADNNHRISIRWCPSHCGIRGNERADRLAKQATSLPSSSTTTRANAIRRAKLAAQKEWTKEWRSAPSQGWFTISDRLPPSLKPTKHARRLAGKRELYGRVVQTRAGHAYTGEFRRRFELDEPYTCPCDNVSLETREHILVHCPRFERWRYGLREVSRDIVLSEILGTDKGIEALEKFLRRSKAFSRPSERPHPTPDQHEPNVDNHPHPVDNG
ncbi:hypothetical protein NMY22_g6022 [Coprinellus aureogranulatus]|nr:hypothetical protein NMY22_g6022 [Coprinellus aureogranulatus]